jgi:homoserine dehydrogenase
VNKNNKNNSKNHLPLPFDSNIVADCDFTSKFYIRLNVKDQTGIIMTAGKLCHDNGVSIHSVLQDPIENPDNVPFVITTEECRRSQVEAFAKSCSEQEWLLSNPLIMPILR